MGWEISWYTISDCFFFSSRRRHTRFSRDWSSDVCSSDLGGGRHAGRGRGQGAAEARLVTGSKLCRAHPDDGRIRSGADAGQEGRDDRAGSAPAMTALPRALITGVTGQDGWYLSELLLSDGYQVFGLAHRDDDAPAPDGVIVVSGDLADSADVQSAVDYAQPDEVYNLAGVSSVALSWERPLLTAEVTGLGLLRVITAVSTFSESHRRRSRIVQASSAE